MARDERSRRNISDDIPLARRSIPIRRPSQRELKLIALFSVLLIFSAIVISLNLFSRFKKSSLFELDTQSALSKDGRLLGHFPYPEALKEDLVEAYPGLQLHRDAYKALMRMASAASAQGINLILLSGYRSIDLQREIFYGLKSARNQIAIERAKVSAPPGYSEHSTGYAVDLGDAARRDTDFEVEFEQTRAFLWLRENAAKYHFVLSFPKGNLQKVSYEPWHWRFEGTVDALRQFDASNENRRRALEPSY